MITFDGLFPRTAAPCSINLCGCLLPDPAHTKFEGVVYTLNSKSIILPTISVIPKFGIDTSKGQGWPRRRLLPGAPPRVTPPLVTRCSPSRPYLPHDLYVPPTPHQTTDLVRVRSKAKQSRSRLKQVLPPSSSQNLSCWRHIPHGAIPESEIHSLDLTDEKAARRTLARLWNLVMYRESMSDFWTRRAALDVA